MSNNRCGHFSLEAEILPVANSAVVLRVPIRRCALAEHMITFISQTEEGRAVAKKLTIVSTRPGTGEPGIRAAFGPDLEAIHPLECTEDRCLTSCTPGYRSLFRSFGYDAEAEKETGQGCLEVSMQDFDPLAQS